MGIFGESKQEIINRYEKIIAGKQSQIYDLTNENISLKNKIEEKNKELYDLRSSILNEKHLEHEKSLNKVSKKLINNEFLNEKNILCAGRYKGGRDLKVGIYNLKIVSGTGIVETKKPDEVFFRITDNKNDIKTRGLTDEYRNLVVTDETIVSISESAKIEFILCKKVCLDKELQKYIIEKENLLKEISEIKSEKIKKGDNIILGIGKYYGGKTIPLGLFNMKIISGSTSVEINKPDNLYFNMSDNSEDIDKYSYIKEYSGIQITNDTVLEIKHDAKIELTLI